MFERMLTGLYLDTVLFESFSCTGVISALFKFDGNTDDAMQLLRLKKKKSANISMLFYIEYYLCMFCSSQFL